jgi:hypothetical protein
MKRHCPSDIRKGLEARARLAREESSHSLAMDVAHARAQLALFEARLHQEDQQGGPRMLLSGRKLSRE